MNRRPGEPAAVFSLQRPALFVQHSVMAATHKCKVGERRLAAAGPPNQVVPIAPGRGPVAMVDDTAAIAGHQRAACGRRDALMRMAGLAFKLRLSQQPAHRCVAGVPLRGFDGNRSYAFQLSGRRVRKPGHGLGASGDDQVGPPAAHGAQLAAVERSAGELDERVDAALPRCTAVILTWRRHQRAEGRLERGTTLYIEQAFQVDQAVLHVADVEIAARIGAVRFGQRRRVIDPILELPGNTGKAARIHGFGGL